MAGLATQWSSGQLSNVATRGAPSYTTLTFDLREIWIGHIGSEVSLYLNKRVFHPEANVQADKKPRLPAAATRYVTWYIK